MLKGKWFEYNLDLKGVIYTWEQITYNHVLWLAKSAILIKSNVDATEKLCMIDRTNLVRNNMTSWSTWNENTFIVGIEYEVYSDLSKAYINWGNINK